MKVYTVRMAPTSQAAAKTLVTVTAPATTILVLLRAWVAQKTLTASELMRILLQRASAAGTSTAVTPEKHQPSDSVFGGVAGVNHTVEPTYTGIPFNNEQVNVLNGFVWVPMPEERIIVPPSGIIGLRLDTAPSGASDFTAGLVFGEIG